MHPQPWLWFMHVMPFSNLFSIHRPQHTIVSLNRVVFAMEIYVTQSHFKYHGIFSAELTWQIQFKQHGRSSIINMADTVQLTWQIQYN